MIEFYFILFAPWILDLCGGRGVLGSFFGAGIWGAAVVVSFVRNRSRNHVFRRRLEFLLGFLAGAWVLYWALSLSGQIQQVPLMEAGTLQYLTWLHAGLLAAGAGMIVVLAAGSFAWMLQDLRLRKSSWERRVSRMELPPLEALAKLCRATSQIAFTVWGAGLFLAVLTTYTRFRSLHVAAWDFARAWAEDPKVFVVVTLWLGLFIALKLPKWLTKHTRWLYRGYFVGSLVFMFLFALMMRGLPSLHERVQWFVR